MRQLRLFPATTVAAILAALVVGAAVVGNIDIVPLSLKVIERIAPGELDEIALGILLIGAGLASDLATQRAHHRAEVEARRQRVFRATIRTVQDIVNNFLTQLKLVQFTAGQDHTCRMAFWTFDSMIRRGPFPAGHRDRSQRRRIDHNIFDLSSDLAVHASNFFTTFPATSVSRKSRPRKR